MYDWELSDSPFSLANTADLYGCITGIKGKNKKELQQYNTRLFPFEQGNI